MMLLVHQLGFAWACLIPLVLPIIGAQISGASTQNKRMRLLANSKFDGDATSSNPEDVCYFELDRHLGDDYPTVLVLKINGHVTQKNRKDFWSLPQSESFLYMQENYMCNRFLDVGKNLNLSLFAEYLWCRESNLFTRTSPELTEVSIYIPIQFSSNKIMLDCGERLRRYYQKNIVTGNIHDFLDEEEPVIVTVDEKLHRVHVTTVIFQLLNSNVTADTWPAKWNATTQELVYEWLHVMNFIRSVLSIKMLPHRSTNIGHYELELVWDVTDPHVRRNIKYANLKNSMDSYFRGRPVGQRLGNMMPRNDPGDSVRDLEVSITNMFSSWRDIHMKQRNCFCSAFEESETLMVAVSTDEVISLNATNKRTIDETRNQIERDLDPLSRKGLKVKTVDASGMNRKESGKRANLLVLYFDQSDEISDGESINYMLTSVKRRIPLRKHGIQLKHPERLQWKAATTTCRFWGKPQLYIDLRLNIIYKGTAQMFHDTVNQLKSKLIVNFRESVIFNELTYFRRFGEKTQMTLHFFVDVIRGLSDATESNGRFRAVWERFTSDMERELRNTSPEIGISTNAKWSLMDVVCPNKQIYFVGDQFQ